MTGLPPPPTVNPLSANSLPASRPDAGQKAGDLAKLSASSQTTDSRLKSMAEEARNTGQHQALHKQTQESDLPKHVREGWATTDPAEPAKAPQEPGTDPERRIPVPPDLSIDYRMIPNPDRHSLISHLPPPLNYWMFWICLALLSAFCAGWGIYHWLGG